MVGGLFPGPGRLIGPGTASSGEEFTWTIGRTRTRAGRQPGSLPYPKLAAGTDTIPQIEHVVVLMMENHSHDNYLGMLCRPGADGFKLGRDGRMDGFVSTPIDPLTTEAVGGVAMGYWQSEDLPFYYSLYRQFPIADRYHSSLLGQTFPTTGPGTIPPPGSVTG